MRIDDLSQIAGINQDIENHKYLVQDNFSSSKLLPDNSSKENFWEQYFDRYQTLIDYSKTLLINENERIQTLDNPHSPAAEIAKKIWLQYYKIHRDSEKSFQLSKTLFSVGCVNEMIFRSSRHYGGQNLHDCFQKQLVDNVINMSNLEQWKAIITNIEKLSCTANRDLEELNKQVNDSAKYVRTSEDQKMVDEFCQIRDKIIEADTNSKNGLA